MSDERRDSGWTYPRPRSWYHVLIAGVALTLAGVVVATMAVIVFFILIYGW